MGDIAECGKLLHSRTLYFMQGKSLGICATLRIQSSTKFFVQKESIIRKPCLDQSNKLKIKFTKLEEDNYIQEIPNKSVVTLLTDVSCESLYEGACLVMGRKPLSTGYQFWSLVEDAPLKRSQVFAELDATFNLQTLCPLLVYYFDLFSGSCIIYFIHQMKTSCKNQEDAVVNLLDYMTLYDNYFNVIPRMKRYISTKQPSQYMRMIEALSTLYLNSAMKSVFLNLKNKSKQKKIFFKLYAFQEEKKEYEVMKYLLKQYNKLRQLSPIEYNDDTCTEEPTEKLSEKSNSLTLRDLISLVNNLFSTPNKNNYQALLQESDKDV